MPVARVDDQEVFYEADGAAGGATPALLFLHGFRNSLESWRPVRSRLDTSRLRAWYLDLPGCGSSTSPTAWKDCTIDVYAHNVHGFCQTLGLDAVVLVGHSLGGGIALTLALEHPELLRALVLVAPTPADGLGYLSEEQLSSLINPSPEELEALALAAFQRPLGPAEFGQLLAVVRSASPQHVEGAIRSQRELQVAGRLHEIKVPTLVVGGDRDRHIPIRHTLRTAAAIRRCNVQIYHDVGHAPFFEVPDEFAALVQHFALNEIGPELARGSG